MVLKKLSFESFLQMSAEAFDKADFTLSTLFDLYTYEATIAKPSIDIPGGKFAFVTAFYRTAGSEDS